MTAKHLGYKRIPLKSIIVPGDFDMAKRIKSDHVNTLAASFKSYGQLEPCIVVPDGNQYRLWAGGDRYAAALLAEFERIDVTVWEATDREALVMQLVENCHRRHSQQEQLEARQQLIELYSQDVDAENLPPAKAKQEVVKRVAKAMGVKPSTVERAERRRRNRENHQSLRPASTIDKGIETLGVELSLEWNEWLEKYKEPFVVATDHMQRVVMNLGRALKTLGNSCPAKSAELMRMVDDLKPVLAKIRGSVPASVCPYCKALDGVLDRCTGCYGSSVISQDQLAQVPRELLETGKYACIYVDGRKYTVAEWEAAHGGEDGEEDAGEPVGQDEPARADWGDL